jgi:hypothetical protein
VGLQPGHGIAVVQLQAGPRRAAARPRSPRVNVDADAARSGPLALQDVAAAQVRFDVGVVRRNVVDDRLIDAGTALAAGVSHLSSTKARRKKWLILFIGFLIQVGVMP